jgi:DNA modification methylase
MKSDAMIEQVVQQWPLDRLREYANNPRQNDNAVEQTAAAINAFGFRVPILARSDGEIVDGHLRLKAARLLGMDTVPVLLADDLSEDQVRAFRISVNKVADLATWDMDKLAAELDALRDDGFDLPVIGFSAQELNDLIGTPNTGFDPDEAPPVPVVPVSRLGDLWILGEHRLLCGDSTKAEDVARLMDGRQAVLLSTDPPYGVSFAGAKYNPTAKAWAAIKNDEHRGDDLSNWLASVWSAWLPYVADNFAFYCWTAAKTEQIAAAAAAAAAGIHVQSQIIWVKNVFALGQADYQWCHENCLYGFYQGKQHRWFGGRDKRTTWFVNRDASSSYRHPTQKPVEIFSIPIRHHTELGDVIAEPFVGSGSQIIAAEMASRACMAMELAPEYFDVSVLRWQEFTGRQAAHNDGRTFAEVRAERCPEAIAA